MPRIRSVHPEQWSDEDFVELSFEARLLAIAIRNFADDKGVFEWKPKTIKMRIFPADNVDVDELLAQLIAQDQVVRFLCDGREYGAIRSFRKFQRPKAPNDIYPLPQELTGYVDGIKENGGEEIAQDFGNASENTGADGEEDGEKKESCAIVRFDEWWGLYPHRGGVKRNRKTAVKKYTLAVKAGVSEQTLIDAARAYTLLCKKIDKLPRDPTTWLNQEGWTDEVSQPATVSEIDIARRNAEAIKSGEEWKCRHISAAAARECMDRGLVTIEECRRAGVA